MSNIIPGRTGATVRAILALKGLKDLKNPTWQSVETQLDDVSRKFGDVYNKYAKNGPKEIWKYRVSHDAVGAASPKGCEIWDSPNNALRVCSKQKGYGNWTCYVNAKAFQNARVAKEKYESVVYYMKSEVKKCAEAREQMEAAFDALALLSAFRQVPRKSIKKIQDSIKSVSQAVSKKRNKVVIGVKGYKLFKSYDPVAVEVFKTHFPQRRIDIDILFDGKIEFDASEGHPPPEVPEIDMFEKVLAEKSSEKLKDLLDGWWETVLNAI